MKYHGVPTDEYSSEELQLLNVADMTIDSSGERVGVKKRLADIQERYGNNSEQYNNAVELSCKIGLI